MAIVLTLGGEVICRTYAYWPQSRTPDEEKVCLYDDMGSLYDDME